MKRFAIVAIALSWLLGLLGMAPGTRTAWAASTWADGNSNWNNALNWSPVGVPNSSSTDVSITDGSSSVTLDISASIANLTLASGNTLTSNPSVALYVYGSTMANGGQIALQGGGGTNTYLVLGNNVTLSGAGALTLNTATGSGSTFIQQAVGGLTLTNQSTIQGSGIIGQNNLALNNSGTIKANSAGSSLISTLTFQSLGATTNTGLMEASNSGVLQINGVTVNNAGGTIRANGSGASVQLYGGTKIQGGTLTNNGGAFFGTLAGHAAYLDGATNGPITLNGTYTSDYGSSTYLAGTINNNNTIQVNGGGGSNAYLLANSSNVTLQGGGTVNLTTLTSGGSAFIEQAAGGLTLTNVDNTIQGSGVIGQNNLTIVNQAGGTIKANSMGGAQTTALTIQSATLSNQGLMEASNSGVLQINGVPVNNAGGNITANGSGASVQLYGGTNIQGGTLTNNGGAFFGTLAGHAAYLDGATDGPITLNGTYTSDYSSSTYLAGTINNNNTIQVNGGGGSNAYLLANSSNVTLQGGGTVTLNTLTGSGSAFIEQAAGGLTLTNVDNTIQGAGIIGQNGLSVTNGAAGTILANAPGQTLLLNGGGTLTNNGTMAAKFGGTLQKDNMTLTNFSGNTLTGGTYIVDGTGAASTMKLSLGSNTGGEIVNNAANIILKGTNANVSFIDANGNQLLSALASNATAGSGLTISDGYNLTTPGDFTNAGTVTVGNASTLKVGPAGTNAYTQSGGLTRGTGTIAGDVTINGGTIKPGLSPGTLTVNGSLLLNSGTFLEEIAGSAAGQFGRLALTGGNIFLDQTNAFLNIDLLNNFNPVGHQFTIMTNTGGSISGMFANAQGAFQMDGYNWTIAYNSNDIVLNAISSVSPTPLPSSLLLLATGLLGLAGWRRRRQ